MITAREPLRARRWFFAFAVLSLVATCLSAYLSIRPLNSGGKEFAHVRRSDLVRHEVGDLRTMLADWQLFAEPYFALLTTAGVKIDAVELAHGAQIVQNVPTQGRAAVVGLRSLGLTNDARNVEVGTAAFMKAITALAPLVSGASTAAVVAATGAERTAFANMWTSTATSTDDLKLASTVDLDRGTTQLDNGRTVILIADGLFASFAVVGALALGQRARRRQLGERSSAKRRGFETVLQAALEMARSESDVYVILDRAFPFAVPTLQVEMLIADSGHAHFRRTVSTEGEGDERSGCGVVSPQDCPAAIRGQTLVFPSSRALDACPYLVGRPSGACSAACVPVSIAGATVGVTHATGRDGIPPTESDLRYLETASHRASDRVGMVRAFETSETQAHSDPLTGLMNRRSLKNNVRDLQRERIPYALAYGDLDHFKILNDTHGHEAGDHALQLFARVMRDSTRPNDIVARYGGEEFVIVLPDCSTDAAVAVLDRLRERLALALTHGRVPSFTVSFGLASSTQYDSFDEIVASADHALMDAKTGGRNRVIVAAGTPNSPAEVPAQTHAFGAV